LNLGLTADISFHDFQFYKLRKHTQKVPGLEHQEVAIQSSCHFHVNAG